MEILTIEIDTIEHVEELKKICESLPFVKNISTVNKVKLTPHNIAFGIGRLASDIELAEYLSTQNYTSNINEEDLLLELDKVNL
ncbi:MAG: hypothetical protein WCI53_04400 [Bacteroidota bacterium]|jgi:hypothetical protein